MICKQGGNHENSLFPCIALFCFVLLAACEPDYVRSGDRFFMVELTNVSDSDMTADLYTRTDRRADNIEEVKASRYEGRLTIERKQTVRLPLYVTVSFITSTIGYCKFVSVVFHAETKEDLFAYICVNSEKSFSVGDRILSYVLGDEYPAESLFHTVFRTALESRLQTDSGFLKTLYDGLQPTAAADTASGEKSLLFDMEGLYTALELPSPFTGENPAGFEMVSTEKILNTMPTPKGLSFYFPIASEPEINAAYNGPAFARYGLAGYMVTE